MNGCYKTLMQLMLMFCSMIDKGVGGGAVQWWGSSWGVMSAGGGVEVDVDVGGMIWLALSNSMNNEVNHSVVTPMVD